jgi:predicted metal-binding protein
MDTMSRDTTATLDADQTSSPTESEADRRISALARQTTLYVCVNCKGAVSDENLMNPAGQANPDEPRAGVRLLDALSAAQSDDDPVTIVGVECLSNCKRSCTVALASEGRWTYVYGDLDPAASVDDILAGAALYARSEDGIVPWRERPAIFKKGVIARIPPLRPLA